MTEFSKAILDEEIDYIVFRDLDVDTYEGAITNIRPSKEDPLSYIATARIYGREVTVRRGDILLCRYNPAIGDMELTGVVFKETVEDTLLLKPIVPAICNDTGAPVYLLSVTNSLLIRQHNMYLSTLFSLLGIPYTLTINDTSVQGATVGRTSAQEYTTIVFDRRFKPIKLEHATISELSSKYSTTNIPRTFYETIIQVYLDVVKDLPRDVLSSDTFIQEPKVLQVFKLFDRRFTMQLLLTLKKVLRYEID